MSEISEKLDRRRQDRVCARLDVSYGVDRPDRRAVVENISESGLYLNTNEAPKPGTKLILRIEFPERVVTLRGEVVWAIQVPEHERASMISGMGVRFINPGAEWPLFFAEWKGAPTPSDPRFTESEK
jgi:hypothetical protein